MGYKSLQDCIEDLEKHGHLLRIAEEVDPQLEMAAIHLKVFAKGGPAILFEKVKGSKYRALSNLFGNTKNHYSLYTYTQQRHMRNCNFHS